jgi:hypothetical protein
MRVVVWNEQADEEYRENVELEERLSERISTGIKSTD